MTFSRQNNCKSFVNEKSTHLENNRIHTHASSIFYRILIHLNILHTCLVELPVQNVTQIVKTALVAHTFVQMLTFKHSIQVSYRKQTSLTFEL